MEGENVEFLEEKKKKNLKKLKRYSFIYISIHK